MHFQSKTALSLIINFCKVKPHIREIIYRYIGSNARPSVQNISKKSSKRYHHLPSTTTNHNLAFSSLFLFSHPFCVAKLTTKFHAAAPIPTGGAINNAHAHHLGLDAAILAIAPFTAASNCTLSASFHTTTPRAVAVPRNSACAALVRTSPWLRTRFSASSAVRWASRARRRAICTAGSWTPTTITVPQMRSMPLSKSRGTSRTIAHCPRR